MLERRLTWSAGPSFGALPRVALAGVSSFGTRPEGNCRALSLARRRALVIKWVKFQSHLDPHFQFSLGAAIETLTFACERLVQVPMNNHNYDRHQSQRKQLISELSGCACERVSELVVT